jgi:hypothetical protein
MKKGIFIYELEQIDKLQTYWDGLSVDMRSSHVVVACGVDIELACAHNKIPYTSAKTLRRTPTMDRLVFTRTYVEQLFNDPKLEFFTYRSIPLKNLYTFVLQEYVVRLLYYIDIFSSAIEDGVCDQVLLFPSRKNILPTAGMLANFEASVALHAARLVVAQHNIALDIQEHMFTQEAASSLHTVIFNIQRKVFGLALGLLNAGVRMFVRRKKNRILGSDMWKNIAPLIDIMPDTELVLLDRSEALVIGWKAIVRNRMNFIHSAQFVSRSVRVMAQKRSQEYLEKWHTVQDEVLQGHTMLFLHYSLQAALAPVVEHLMAQGTLRAVQEIEGTYAMYAALDPHVVLLRAGVSAQTHFAVLGYVAQACGIPSLEVQHGLLYLGKGSFLTHRAAEYIAEYGPRARQELREIGYSDRQLFDVGSPRFDVYTTEPKMHRTHTKNKLAVLVIAPDVIPGSWTDSYDVEQFYECLAQAASSVPNISCMFKLRPDQGDYQLYVDIISRLFAQVPHTIVQDKQLVRAFAVSDVVVSYYSTILLEAMANGKPTVFASYAEAGALNMVQNSQELTALFAQYIQHPEEMSQAGSRAQTFMQEQYSFDGNASSKLAAIVQTLAASKSDVH